MVGKYLENSGLKIPKCAEEIHKFDTIIAYYPTMVGDRNVQNLEIKLPNLLIDDNLQGTFFKFLRCAKTTLIFQ